MLLLTTLVDGFEHRVYSGAWQPVEFSSLSNYTYPDWERVQLPNISGPHAPGSGIPIQSHLQLGKLFIFYLPVYQPI